jgi:hypothetical protein
MDFKRSFLHFQGKRIFPRSFPESTGLAAAVTTKMCGGFTWIFQEAFSNSREEEIME